MPEIKLKHVVSCSSEDSTHKADNLLSSDTYRKWKAARPGEKQVSVILQLEKEEQIHSIDIGNEGSAFIEVLVGHSTSVKDQDFQVLLVTSSFMSPTESRNGTNTNRVRLFGPSQLVKAMAQEKWDCVKIVCSQPYSKSIAYGVAFIKLHSPPDANDVPVSTPPVSAAPPASRCLTAWNRHQSRQTYFSSWTPCSDIPIQFQLNSISVSRCFSRYLMNGAESSSESEAEEDESEEETQKAKTPEKRQTTPKKQPIKEEEEEEEYGGSTDAEDPADDGSGMDTEDELNRVEMESRRKKAAKESAAVQVKDEDLYGGSTDENTDAEEEEDKPIPELPDFLTGKRFYLYGKFPDNQKRQLQRYIIAFNGAVEDYMSEKVQFVVTSEGWDESFEDFPFAVMVVLLCSRASFTSPKRHIRSLEQSS
ncbi:DNA repair protein XRCC1-like [Sinocyclocheilus grahami]|uniref:DNA repair protein XRCC1-like n=1 Tax=Sinocyclocheilus grahami TaxID=75366 RepID=UPI0007AC5FBD|nr:PREDICTED: DNA repair protein XRCC1-like [Sinocyclocheilus grahami]